MLRTLLLAGILVPCMLLATFVSCSPPKNSDATPGGASSVDNRANDGGTDSEGGSATTNKTATVTAWTMLTETDLKTIAGADYTRLESQGDYSYLKHCAYQDTDGGNVSVTAVFANAQQRYDTFLRYPNLQSVDGIGNQASWSPDLDSLCVLTDKGAVEVQFRKKGVDPANRLETAKKIARLVLDRI